MKKKEKNNAVEFWRFLFTIVIVAGHINRNYPNQNTIFGGAGNVLVIFLVLSGYFLMKSYQSSKAKGLTENVAPAKQAVRYFGKRFRRLYPVLLVGIISCFITRNVFVLHNPISQWPNLFINSIFEFFGIVITGIGMSEPDLWFPAGWYISVLLVCGYLVYYLVAKDEDKFVGFIGPLIIILVYGYWFLSWTKGGPRSSWWELGFGGLVCNGLLRGMAGISLGVCLYPLIENLKKIKFGEVGKIMLTILNACIIVFVCWSVYTSNANWTTGYISGNTENAVSMTLFIISFIIIIQTILALIQKDYISTFLNKKCFGYLGNLSIYMYVCHRAFAFCLPVIFPTAPYYLMMFLICTLTILAGIIVSVLDDYLFQPTIDKIIVWYKKSTKEAK